MVQEPRQDQPEEDSDEGNQVDDSGANTGCSKYARGGKDSDVESWLKSKEEKRTKAAGQGLGRRVGLTSRKGLNPVSKKQKKKNSSYQKEKYEFFQREDNQKCFLCGCLNNLSLHHRKKRGEHVDDALYFMALCMVGNFMDEKYPDSNHSHSGGCHGWTHANGELARELKLII